MKRLFCLAILPVMCLSLCACGEGEQSVTTTNKSPVTTTATTTTTERATTTTTTPVTEPYTILTDDGLTYALEGDSLVVQDYCGSEEIVEIPQTVDGKQVVEIGFEAFRDSSVKQVIVPFGVKKISAFAFFGSALESIDIPETVTFIGNNAFSYTNLTELETPMGISTISAEMLSFCDKLEAVIITSNITAIDYGAFAFCQSLEAVYVPYSVDYIADDAFEGWFDGLVLYGEEDSYAEQYAEDMGMEFEVV